MSMFNDISCATKDNEQECLAHARVVSLYARRFGTRQWSFIGPGSEKKWYSMSEDSPQGIWDKIAERMLLEFAESGCPIFRATTPLSRGQLRSKRHGKLSIHFAATQETIEAIFRIIVSANQLSFYGAVAEMCEEYESLHERTGRPVVMGQSIVLSANKTQVSLDCENTKIGPVLEVATSYLHGKYGVEIRIRSQNGDNTHSWVRISHGSNNFVMDSYNNDTEVPEDQLEEQALQLDAKDFACRSKAKAKPQRREPANSSSDIIPMNRRTWIDIEPGKHSLSAYEVSKTVMHLLRHSQQVHREEDGAVHFW